MITRGTYALYVFYKLIMFHIYKFIKFEIRACAQSIPLKYWSTSQPAVVVYLDCL